MAETEPRPIIYEELDAGALRQIIAKLQAENASLCVDVERLADAARRNLGACTCHTTMRPDLPCGTCVLRRALASVGPAGAKAMEEIDDGNE